MIFKFCQFLLSFEFSWEDKSNTWNGVLPHFQIHWIKTSWIKMPYWHCINFHCFSLCLEMTWSTFFHDWYITWGKEERWQHVPPVHSYHSATLFLHLVLKKKVKKLAFGFLAVELLLLNEFPAKDNIIIQ